MQDSKSLEPQNPEAESTRFNKSLQELKDLCSQLHYAADYCEENYLNAKQKKNVIENTKEYICKAVVTVVDHLGSVSANLEYQVSKNNPVSDTELRIDSLNQRLNTCQQYSHKLTLSKYSWRANSPRYHPRYISPSSQDLQKSNEVLRKNASPLATKIVNKSEFETGDKVPLFLYTYNRKPSIAKDLSMDVDAKKMNASSPSVLPVRDGPSMLPKAQNPSFHFEKTHKLKRNLLNWKKVPSNDILSLIRKSKRAA